MTTITIFPDTVTGDKTMWRAFVGNKTSLGKTAGEALDSLTAQLSDEDSSTIVVRQMQPDRFFSATQQQRLAALMSRWRDARDAGTVLPPLEQAELEDLVKSELEASTRRAEQLSHEMIK